MLKKLDPVLIDLMCRRNSIVDVMAEHRTRRVTRKQRILGLGQAWTVGTITAYNGVAIKHLITGTITGTAAVSGDSAPTVDIARTLSTTQTYGTSGADTGNQYMSIIFTATKNTTTSLDFSGVLADAFGVAAATFTAITAIWFEYLTSAQDSVNGSNASATADVKVKFGAANPATSFGPLGADGFFYLGLGDKFMMECHDATGWAITGGSADTIDFVHAVNDYDAKIRITIFGRK